MYVCMYVCVCIRICVLQVYYPLNIYAIPKQEIIFRARGTSISGNHILGKKSNMEMTAGVSVLSVLSVLSL